MNLLSSLKGGVSYWLMPRGQVQIPAGEFDEMISHINQTLNDPKIEIRERESWDYAFATEIAKSYKEKINIKRTLSERLMNPALVQVSGADLKILDRKFIDKRCEFERAYNEECGKGDVCSVCLIQDFLSRYLHLVKE